MKKGMLSAQAHCPPNPSHNESSPIERLLFTISIVTVLGLMLSSAKRVDAQGDNPPSAGSGIASQVTNSAAGSSTRRSAHHSTYDDHLSTNLNNYLHEHHLPYVDAMVFSDASGDPQLIKLSGRVRTEHGKQDAATKSADFLSETAIRVQNHIDVDPDLHSSVTPSSYVNSDSTQASNGSVAEPSVAAVSNDPCSDLCVKDEGHCKTACTGQASSGASLGSWGQLLGQMGQSATQLQQCSDQCVQTREHCVYDCQQNSRSEYEPAESSVPAESQAQHREGPNIPPE